jgi:glycosyltransferase involved in cell wall biosynthesis
MLIKNSMPSSRLKIKRNTPPILADARWQGPHGIGRFSAEVLSRLQHSDLLANGPPPLSMRNLVWQSYVLSCHQSHAIFFTPGFNPVLWSAIPFVLTIHDLIHLHPASQTSQHKIFFYNTCIKSAVKRAYHILTVSEYTKQAIRAWANIAPEKITVVPNGISASFQAFGPRHTPGYPYLLHVGHHRPHKNIVRLIQAFAHAHIDPAIKLLCIGHAHPTLITLITQHHLHERIVFSQPLTEQQLSAYYRGALGVVFPSLCEGFGLPVIEGMASGIPVMTSHCTALPEIAGDAALLVDPYDVDSITHGIEQLIHSTETRRQLITKGLARCQLFSWDQTAQRIQTILDKGVTH